MTQLTLNIENTSIIPHLKKILNALDGVTVAKTSRKRKSGIEEALEDIKAGRINHAKNVDDMFKQILGI